MCGCTLLLRLMGIDKPDIRFVIHYDVQTKDVSRDGKSRKRWWRRALSCLLFYKTSKTEKFLESKNKTEKDIASMHLEEVVAINTSISRRKYLLNYFGEYFDSQQERQTDGR